MTPITWQAAVDVEEQRPQLQDSFEAAIDGNQRLRHTKNCANFLGPPCRWHIDVRLTTDLA